MLAHAVDASESSQPRQGVRGLVIATFAFVTVFAASAVPIPLYSEYKGAIGLTDADISATMLMYLFGVVLTLFLSGSLSDAAGRRPLAAASLLLAMLGCFLFLRAADPTIVQVKFAEWTEDGLLRHPSYQGIRTDKDPHDVQREPASEPDEQTPDRLERPMNSDNEKNGELRIDGVRITNPGKLLFEDPPITKEDVVRYYASMADRMLPYASGRILSIVRCPRGADSACFFKKHPGPSTPGVRTVDIPTSSGDEEPYFYVEDAVGLVSEVQMDTLEFHLWGSRVDTLEQPDMMVFDLDPDKGLGLEQVRRGVRDLKGILDELGLTSFLKTSGGKGYHVVLPFQPAASWDAFHDFARRIAQVMAEKWPDRYTSNVRLAKRTGKVFIDWMRNGRGATSIAPYSLRARSGARVSMPLSWKELDQTAPDAFTMDDALARIDGDDPWDGYFDVDQALE